MSCSILDACLSSIPLSGMADGLKLKYYPCCSTGSTGSVIVSLIGEGNPKLSSMVILVVVLKTSWTMPLTS